MISPTQLRIERCNDLDNRKKANIKDQHHGILNLCCDQGNLGKRDILSNKRDGVIVFGKGRNAAMDFNPLEERLRTLHSCVYRSIRNPEAIHILCTYAKNYDSCTSPPSYVRHPVCCQTSLRANSHIVLKKTINQLGKILIC